MKIRPEEAEDYAKILTSMPLEEFVAELAEHFTAEQAMILMELLIRSKTKTI